MLNSTKTITRGELALAINQIRKNNKNKEKEQPRIEYGDPYIISIKNTTKKKQMCKLFGFAENFDKPNFGNPEGIIISNVNGSDVDYKAMVVELAIKPMKVGKWRFISENKQNLLSTMQMFDKSSNGFTQSRPLQLSLLLDPYQYNSNTLQSKRIFVLNVCVSFEIPVDANSEITIMLYPIKSTSEPTKEEIENNIFDQIDEILFIQNNQDEIINGASQATDTKQEDTYTGQEGLGHMVLETPPTVIDSSTSEQPLNGPTPPAEDVVAEKDWGKLFEESGLLDGLTELNKQNGEFKIGDKKGKVRIFRISFKKLYDDKSTKKAPAKKTTKVTKSSKKATKPATKPVAKKNSPNRPVKRTGSAPVAKAPIKKTTKPKTSSTKK